MPKLDQIVHEINLSDDSSVNIDGFNVTISNGGKTVSREFRHPKVTIRNSHNTLEVYCNLPRRPDKAIAGTWAAHLRNMVKGVEEGFEYKLQAVYSHFPMTLKVEGDRMVINNLFGEKVPRVAKLPWTPSEVEVKVENKTDVTVSGVDREKVGQTAANIERSCKIKKRDRRVFQDGIYIVSKGA